MKIAFVGIKRKYQELDGPSYRDTFNKYHLELPYYYARDGHNDVVITTVDYESDVLIFATVEKGRVGSLQCIKEADFQNPGWKYDVVIHWRKWFPEFYVPGAVNLINCQDHSFSPEWKNDVRTALSKGELTGILCFPTWHKRNLSEETGVPHERLFDGVTLGVDTQIYAPAALKDPYSMLWASDPGRGFVHALQLAIYLWKKDRQFRLHVCYPDYVKGEFIPKHPAIINHGCVKNGPELWGLFNSTGILPYTSTFKEPSSRAHRQAQAAASMVVYPIGMGSPSELIDNDKTGLIAQNDTALWGELILEYVKSGRWATIGDQARRMAISENWEVQALRFNKLIERIKE